MKELTGGEVVEEDAALGGFLAPVADDDAGAVDDLAGVSFAVESAFYELAGGDCICGFGTIPQKRRKIEPHKIKFDKEC